MAVLGRVLFSSAERLDLPDVLAIDSYVAGDFKYLLNGLTGSNPIVLKGFDVINPQDSIGTQSLSIRVANSVVFHPSSTAGSFFHGLEDTSPYAQPLVPELRKNAVNFVYLTLTTFDTASDTRAFWDVDKDGGVGGEFTQDINTESVLQAQVGVSVASFPEGSIPLCKVTVGPVVITAIQDCRNMMFRLGAGGINPDPFYRYQWDNVPSGYSRTETPTTMTSALNPNPFEGADKNIQNLKEWMDAVMSKLAELGGSTYWYENTSTYNDINLFINAIGTSFTSKGEWQHSSATPGLVTWTEDLILNHTSDPRNIIVRAGSAQLGNDQTLFLQNIFDKQINSLDNPVSWTNGSNTVNGSIGYFENLQKGDWVRQKTDPNHRYLRVEEFYANIGLGGGPTTPALARSIKLSANYQGLTGTYNAVYTKGIYQPTDLEVVDRNDPTLTVLGGDVNWLAHRWDTIMNIQSMSATTVAGVASEGDGESLKITSVGHGLQDGEYITFDAPIAGTYVVEVETADIFYISTTSTYSGAVTGYYGVGTTTTRSTADGLQLESANHHFNNGDTVIIAGTASSFDGARIVAKRNATEFQFGMPTAPSPITTGTATLAVVNVRSEIGIDKIVQGESSIIGDTEGEAIRTYIGMGSSSQTAPNYVIPGSYNTLHGTTNYNSTVGENLTARVSKLTAMIADKAQDKTIKYLVSEGLNYINNTTNAGQQEITFSPAGNALTIVTPSSTGNCTIMLPDSGSGWSLANNQVAYVYIDRNNPTSGTVLVSDIDSLDLDENVFVVAARLSGNAIYLWDGSVYGLGSTPSTAFLRTVVEQNLTAKLVEGGTWSWTLGNTLAWSSDARIQVPGLASTANIIPAGNIVLSNANDVAYVELNRVNPGGTLSVLVSDSDTLQVTSDTVIIARREGSDVIVGMHSTRLIAGESKKIYAGMSDQNLAYIGATDEADLDPNYISVIRNITQSQNLTEAVSSLDTELDKFFGQLKIVQTTVPSTRVIIRGADYTMLDGTVFSQEISNLLMKFDGAQIDFATGETFEADGITPLGVDFVPATIPAGQYQWYSVSLVPSSLTVDGRLTVKCIVVKATSTGPSASAAPRAAFGGTKKLGQVVVYSPTGTGIAAITNSSIVQLGTGSGGSGAGFQEIDLHDVYSTALPTGTGANIDGVALVDGMKVLFTNLAVGNNSVYQVSGVGTSLSWSAQNMFALGSTTPQNGATVLVLQGTAYNNQIGIFDSTYWSFGDLSRQFNIYGDYYETSSPRKLQLNPSTTDVVFQVAATGSENFIVDFSIVRGLNKETGSLYITHNGIEAAIATSNANINSTGVTFTADIDSGNVRLLYTADASVGTPILTFSIKRWSDASGGPASSLPSYTVSSIVANGSSQTAYVMSDNSGTPVNCTATFNVLGKTRVQLANPYVMNVLPGTTYSDIEVYVDGQFMPRYLSGVTQDGYFVEIDSTTIEFHTDLQVYPVSIEVRKRLYVGDVTPVINRQYAIYDAIVGSSAQVTSGAATHTSLQQAVTDSPAGSTILILSGTYTENVSINKTLTVQGQGFATVLNGNITLDNLCIGSHLSKIKFDGDIVLNVGSSYNYIVDGWRLSVNTLIDNGASNIVNVLAI